MKILKICGEIIVDIIFKVIETLKSSIYPATLGIEMALPYVMLVLGQYLFLLRGKIAFGGEIFIPLIFGAIIYFCRKIANRLGKGVSVPVPNKRFTEVLDDGEVTIENSRLQELILYVADLENWMERNNLIR